MRYKIKEIFLKLFQRSEKEKIRGQEDFNSQKYWNNRYSKKENSGAGSYGRLAEFKANIINNFVQENNVKTVIELGCGDGNQLKLAKYKSYIGFDVSKEAIKICENVFKTDQTKLFRNYSNISKQEYFADLVISLDVIFHLIEEEVFQKYMENLFRLSSRFVIIYSCNYDKVVAPHVKCRKFTEWIDSELKGQVTLVKFIPNKYPYDPELPNLTSFSDFYIYEKVRAQ